MFGQQVAIELGGVLRTTIRVVDAALWRLPYSDEPPSVPQQQRGHRSSDMPPDGPAALYLLGGFGCAFCFSYALIYLGRTLCGNAVAV
jgi:hypothetical protein